MVPNTLRFASDAFASGPYQRTLGDEGDSPYWGEDVTAWLVGRLATAGWTCDHCQEDWGWWIGAKHGTRHYHLGVYWEPPGFNPPPDDCVGLWCIRLWNKRDPRSWLARLTSRDRAPVDADVFNDVKRLVESSPEVRDMRTARED
ncbi:MAG: hypothetical protein ACKVS8_08075 [Phycisphaerales bacterium]